MLGDRGRQLEETEMHKQRISAELEALKGWSHRKRPDV